ncbi:MAG: hypothetical protein KGI19_10565 [Thaumarchaeota archaeon]|nr:hypothetical protein [Nitrososphaerota archaeon]
MVLSEEVLYKNKKITIQIEKNKPHLYIDGKSIHVSYHEAADTYHTNYLGYERYSSLEELAKALIDNGRVQ